MAVQLLGSCRSVTFCIPYRSTNSKPKQESAMTYVRVVMLAEIISRSAHRPVYIFLNYWRRHHAHSATSGPFLPHSIQPARAGHRCTSRRPGCRDARCTDQSDAPVQLESDVSGRRHVGPLRHNQPPQARLRLYACLDTPWMSGGDVGIHSGHKTGVQWSDLTMQGNPPDLSQCSRGTLNVYAGGGERLWSANCAELLSCSLRSSFS